MRINTIASPWEETPQWSPRPFHLVRLLDMFRFYWSFVLTYAELRFLLNEITNRADTQGDRSVLDQATANDLRDKLVAFENECKRSGFGSVLDRFNKLSHLTPTLQELRVGDLRHQLIELLDAADLEARKRVFLVLAEEERRFNLKHPFGESVYRQFEFTRYDVREAKNCFALGRYTACVFHLMRVVERGLRTLAKALKVKCPGNRPIDITEWGGLIDAIERKISEIERKRRTTSREADLKFYHGAAAQFRHFKNAWRNHIMHGRATYDSDEAIMIMRHVDEFMRHLATRLKERP